MKKMLRIAAALAALLAMTNFIGCKNDDDDESGNGLENTYWATEEISTDVVENVSLTLKNGMYVHIEDSSKGSVYGADIENLDYSKLDYTKTNSVDISYSSEKQSFTYVVDGSKITITSKYTDDDGKEKTEIIEGTLAADKKSFTTKYTDDDGKEVSETYTRIDKAPAKATLVITVTGGSTGGETGTTTGFENTYWVIEEVPYENSGVKITLKNAQYIHLVDSTSGSIYIANVEDYLKGSVVAGTHSVSYPDKGAEFTYTVEGSNVTIKMGEETINAVIAADKNSFTITDGSETHEYTKAAAAPTEATVTVEVTAAPSTGVNAAWDFNVASLTAVGLDLTNKVKPNADKEIAVTSGSGATLTLLAQTGKSLKIQSAETGGLNVGAGSAETEVLSITVEGACTLKFNGKGSSGATFATTKPNSFSVNGTKVYERASADETSYQDFTYSITEAGTYKIAASGMIFTALTCE